jgi:hypothetical protein
MDNAADIPPLILRWGSFESDEPLPISILFTERHPSILTGRTGMGKTTAGLVLRHDAALEDRVVLLAHAETYLPGRLDALVADAISELVGEDLPAATGRQALNDVNITLVIDGVSEVPEDVQRALHDELLAPVAARRGAQIVVLGRDIAALRAVLPSSVRPLMYQMAVFKDDRLLDLACRALYGIPAGDVQDVGRLQWTRAIVARVNDVLGDATDNPLVFSMALPLVAANINFTNRASLYKTAIDRLAERTGAVGVAVASAVLAIVYTRLLDHGRRHADPVEWSQVLVDAAEVLAQRGVHCDANSVDAAARRCGLIAPLGWAQILVPIHDSFADYLAGTAHARGHVALPGRLAPGDDQRILFTAEIGGVDADMAALTARDLPFLTVRLADYDRRCLNEDTPGEVESLLQLLAPPDDGRSVRLWRTDNGDVVALRCGDSRSAWVDEATARLFMRTTASAIVENGGPLSVTVRLWRLHLVERLRPLTTMPAQQARTLQDACRLLADHVTSTRAEVYGLVEALAPRGQANLLRTQIGPLGLSATIAPRQPDPFGGIYWPVSYSLGEIVDVRSAADRIPTGCHAPHPVEHQGPLEVFLHRNPHHTATEHVRKAIEALTVPRWLVP